MIIDDMLAHLRSVATPRETWGVNRKNTARDFASAFIHDGDPHLTGSYEFDGKTLYSLHHNNRDLLVATSEGITEKAISIPSPFSVFYARGVPCKKGCLHDLFLLCVEYSPSEIFVTGIQESGPIGIPQFTLGEWVFATQPGDPGRLNLSFKSDRSDITERAHNDYLVGLNLFLAALTLLNTRQTVVEEVRPARALNDARKKKGRPPLRPYHIVKKARQRRSRHGAGHSRREIIASPAHAPRTRPPSQRRAQHVDTAHHCWRFFEAR